MNVSGASSAVNYVDTLPSALPLQEVLPHLKLRSALRTNAGDSVLSRSCLRDLARPMSVFLIGLAVAVALWEFAYKLSLYGLPRNHSSHVSVAKLWLGPERQPGLIASHITKVPSWPAPSMEFDLVHGTMPPIHGRQARWTLSACFFVPPGSPSLVGSRSPPSSFVSMRSLVVA